MQLVICHKNRANLFAARTHRLHDKGSQECFFSLTHRGAYCQALEADGNVATEAQTEALKDEKNLCFC